MKLFHRVLVAASVRRPSALQALPLVVSRTLVSYLRAGPVHSERAKIALASDHPLACAREIFVPAEIQPRRERVSISRALSMALLVLPSRAVLVELSHNLALIKRSLVSPWVWRMRILGGQWWTNPQLRQVPALPTLALVLRYSSSAPPLSSCPTCFLAAFPIAPLC